MELNKYHSAAYFPHLEFWKGQFQALTAPTFICGSQIRNTQERAELSFQLDENTSAFIKKLVNGNVEGSFVVFLSSLQVALGAFSGNKQVIVNVPSKGNTELGSKQHFFHLDLQTTPTFKALLIANQGAYKNAQKYADLPLELIADKLHTEQLSNVVLYHQNLHQIGTENAAGLCIQIRDQGSCFELQFNYNTGLFSAEEVTSFMKIWQECFKQIQELEKALEEVVQNSASPKINCLNAAKIDGHVLDLDQLTGELKHEFELETVALTIGFDQFGQNQLHLHYTSKNTFDANQLTEKLKSTHQLSLGSFVLTDLQENKNRMVSSSSETEETILKIWQQVLGRDSIQLNDNFFEIGGHSLRAMSIVALANERLQKSLDLERFFNNPTIAGLALQYDQASDAYAEVKVLAKQADYTLSPAQKRLWLLDQIQRGSIAYNMPAHYAFDLELNHAVLCKAMELVLLQNEALRSNFIQIGEEPRVVIRESCQVDLPLLDLSQNHDFERLLQEKKEQLANFPFDLANDNLIQFVLIKENQTKWHLLIVMHHIISDGWSIQLLEDQLKKYYQELTAGKQPIVETNTYSYKDYAHWQNELLSSPIFTEHRDYWHNKLAAPLAQLELPRDFDAQAEQKHTGSQFHFYFSEKEHQEVLAYAKKHELSLFMFLLATFKLAVYQWTGESDLLVGTPVAGRQRAEFESIIGFFLNTVILRSQVEANQSFENYLKAEKKGIIEAFKYQDYPFEQLVDELKIPRNTDRFPLTPLFFNMLNFRAQKETEELFYEGHIKGSAPVKFDLNLYASERENALIFRLDYKNEYFAPESITAFAQNYKQLILKGIKKEKTEINEVISTDFKLINKDGQRAAWYAPELSLPQLFDRVVKQFPSNRAVVYRDQVFTYRELDQWSNGVANQITAKNRSKQAIGVYLNHNHLLAPALLGVLKAGPYYVPLNQSYPEELLHDICREQEISYILTDSSLVLPSFFEGKELIYVDQLDLSEKINFPLPSDPSARAYVLFTSGTTGKSKGIAQNQATVLYYISAYSALMGIQESWNLSGFSALSFDSFNKDFYGALLNGACYCPASIQADLAQIPLSSWLSEQQIHVLHLVPSLFRVLSENDLITGKKYTNLRVLKMTGEATKRSDFERFKQLCTADTRFVVSYGSTESSLNCFKSYSHETVALKHILSPGICIADTEISIHQENGLPLPKLGIGEIWISSNYLATNYTKNKNVENSIIIKESGKYYYRTGDMGRVTASGELELVGRRDHQLKIRGIRIELGEIEQYAEQISGLKQALVTLQGDDELVLYYSAEFELSKREIRAYLKNKLPAVALPTYFKAVKNFPLNSHGKIDRAALPIADSTDLISSDLVEEASTETEIQLASIWRTLLKKETINIHANFFELGGNSLKATAFVARLLQATGVQLSLNDVFTTPTIKQLALKCANDQPVAFAPFSVYEDQASYPLSPAQLRLYILHQLEPEACNYNMPIAYLFEGALEIDRLESAFKQLLKRHEILRYTIFEQDGQVVQGLNTHSAFKLAVVSGQQEEQDQDIQNFVKPFNLATGPLFRSQVIRYSEHTHLLLFDVHHIIADARSMHLLLEELIGTYNGSAFQKAAYQFKDYTRWFKQQANQVIFAEQEKYWLDRFSEASPVLNLPYDFKRPALQSFEGKRLKGTLSDKQAAAVLSFSSEQGLTPFMTLLTCFATTMHHYSGNQDITIGTPISGRPMLEMENMLGMFVNTLLLRSFPETNKSLSDFAQEIKQTAIEAFDRQFFSYEILVNQVQNKRDLSRNPLFDVLFVLQEQQQKENKFRGDLQISNQTQSTESSKFDLSLQVYQNEDNFNFDFEYCTALFQEKTIQHIADSFLTLIDQLPTEKETTLGKLRILPLDRAEAILNRSYPKRLDPRPYSLENILQQGMNKQANKLAIVDATGSFTYEELNQYANAFAESFKKSTSERIGLYVAKSRFYIAALLGTIRAGKSFVNLDLSAPIKRIAYQLKDAQIDLVVCSKNQACPNTNETLFIEDVSPQADFQTIPIEENRETYVLYTSGSTGQPKGVLIGQDSLCEKLLTESKHYAWNADLTTILTTNTAFDVALLEILAPIVNGGKLVIPDPEQDKDFIYLYELICAEKVTAIQGTSSYYKNLLANLQEQNLSAAPLKDLYIGGESLTPTLVEQLRNAFPQAQIHNHYGPTETTIDAVVKSHIQVFNENAIGKPLANVEILILNEALQLVPEGVSGEICIGGISLAKAYLNQVEQSDKAFVQHPFRSEEKIYRTGDLGKWNQADEIVFLGRKDQQVKIRGFRIELQEIQIQLEALSFVQEVAVHHLKNSFGDEELYAYLVAQEKLDFTTVRSELQKQLPHYMIPSYFFQLDEIPLTRNGKVAYVQLPISGIEEVRISEKLDLNDNQNQLFQVWGAILGHPNFGIDDNFFEIGGHSLKATQIISQLQKIREQKLNLKDFFRYPTIRSYAHFLEEVEVEKFQAIPLAESAEFYPLSHPQKRLWVIDQIIEQKEVYNMYQALELEGNLQVNKFEEALLDLIQRHEALRTSFIAIDGNPKQQIHEQSLFKLQNIDFSQEENPDERARAYCLTAANTPFDLSKNDLFRCFLIKIGENKHVFFQVVHHIICDGWSQEIMLKEFTLLYQSKVNGETINLVPLRIQYKDVATYQHEQNLEVDEAYWLQQLSGNQDLIPLPYDFPKTEEMQSQGDNVSLTLEKELVDRLKMKAKEHQTSLSNVVFTVFNILLKQLSGQHDLLVGMTIANRNHPDLENIIGFLVNSLVIRTTVDEELSFDELLKQVIQSNIEAFEHQNYPYDLLVEKLNPQRFASRQPLVNVTYSFQNLKDLKLENYTLETQVIEEGNRLHMHNFALGKGNQTTKYDLLLFVNEIGDLLHLKFEYDSKLFKPESMTKYINFFKRFLSMVQVEEKQYDEIK